MKTKLKLSKREKLIFYLSISLFLLLVLERMVFSPLVDRLSALNQEIQLKESKLMKGWRIQAKKDQILTEYKKFEIFFKTKASDEEVTSMLLKEMEKIARESGVALSNLKPRPSAARGLYREYWVELQTEAPMEKIITFMYKVNDSQLLLNVDRLILSLKEEGKEDLKAIMVVSAIVIL